MQFNNAYIRSVRADLLKIKINSELLFKMKLFVGIHHHHKLGKLLS